MLAPRPRKRSLKAAQPEGGPISPEAKRVAKDASDLEAKVADCVYLLQMKYPHLLGGESGKLQAEDLATQNDGIFFRCVRFLEEGMSSTGGGQNALQSANSNRKVGGPRWGRVSLLSLGN